MPSKKNNAAADKSAEPAAGATVTPATQPAATGLNISAEALEPSATSSSSSAPTADDPAASSPSGDSASGDSASVAADPGRADQPSASASGDGPAPVAGAADPPASVSAEAGTAPAAPPAPEAGPGTAPTQVTTAAAPSSAPLPPFPWETLRAVEIPTAVPVVAPAVVDAIAAVPDDHRGDYRQLISSLAAVNHGLHNAHHALLALQKLCGSDSGRELLVARGINAPEVLGRLFHFLDVPDAD